MWDSIKLKASLENQFIETKSFIFHESNRWTQELLKEYFICAKFKRKEKYNFNAILISIGSSLSLFTPEECF